MSIRDRIIAAARQLAADRPADKVTLTEVARAAGVSWPTVRRHVGSREKLLELLGPESGTADASPDTRSRIIAAAAQVFAERGLAGASLDEVAASAGLTKGAVYWHFANKNDLVMALLEDHIQTQIARIPTGKDLFPPGTDPTAAVAASLMGVLQSCLHDRNWGRLFMEFIASAREPEVRHKLQRLYRAIEDLIIDRVRLLGETGRLAPGFTPQAVAVIVTALIDGLIMRSVVEGPDSVTPETVTQLARILITGIHPRL